MADEVLDDVVEEVEEVEDSEDELVDDESESEEGEQQEDSESEEDDEEVKSEEEQEEEKPEEEDEQLPSKYHRPVFSEIKSKYPTFFKDFPDMREVYFRESKFSTIFPTVEDAEEAFSKSNSFDTLAQSLVNGSSELLLDELEKAGKDRVVELTENFLPTVYKKSPDLYYSVVSPLIEGFIKNLWNEGEKTGNDSMKAAAMYAAQFGYGHTDVEKLGQTQKRIDPQIQAERQRIEQERNQIAQGRYQEAYSSVASRSQKLLVTEISKAVSPIKDDFKRSAAVREIFEKVNEVLTSDERHIRLMNSLWAKAQKSGFSPESRNRLVFTLLARAKQVMPAVSREIMAQIQKPSAKKVVKKDAGGKVTGSEKSTQTSSMKKEGKVDWSKYNSGADFLSAFVEGKGKVARR